jgi:hypothetical protein
MPNESLYEQNHLAGGAGPAAAKTVPSEDAPWRYYPQFDHALGVEQPAVIEKAVKTCRALNDVLQSGSEPEKARARAGLTAYGRALELYRKLADRRDQLVAATEQQKSL